MGVFQNLSVVALRQLVGGACSAVGIGGAGAPIVDFLANRFTDHSSKLITALQTANERAWKAIEVALAGDSLWDKYKTAVASAEDKAFREQVRAFLEVSPFKNRTNDVDLAHIFRDALKELRVARDRGLLTGGPLGRTELASFNDPQGQLDTERKVVEQIAQELQESCPNLGRVLVTVHK